MYNLGNWSLMFASISGQMALACSLSNGLVQICLYCLNCTKFGESILRKIINTVATNCHILRLKCTKFDFTALPRQPSWI